MNSNIYPATDNTFLSEYIKVEPKKLNEEPVSEKTTPAGVMHHRIALTFRL